MQAAMAGHICIPCVTDPQLVPYPSLLCYSCSEWIFGCHCGCGFPVCILCLLYNSVGCVDHSSLVILLFSCRCRETPHAVDQLVVRIPLTTVRANDLDVLLSADPQVITCCSWCRLQEIGCGHNTRTSIFGRDCVGDASFFFLWWKYFRYFNFWSVMIIILKWLEC